MRNKLTFAVVAVVVCMIPLWGHATGMGVTGCANQGGPATGEKSCDSCQNSPTKSQEGGTQCDLSFVNNVHFSYAHIAVDYDSQGVVASGCSTCSGTAPLPGTELSGLKITRYHRYTFSTQQTSLGPGVGFEYDINLTLSPEPGRTDGAAGIQISDPESALDKYGVRDAYAGSSYDGVWDGVYHLEAYGRHPFKQLELRDANDNVVVDFRTATHAVMEKFDGRVLTFELFEVSQATGAPRYGRLISMADRNGNQTTISYVYAANSNPDIRSKLWQIASVTDTYGKQADFHYQATTVGGRWAVDYIDLPAKDDSSRPRITYSYGTINGAPGLTGVGFPDGSSATFSSHNDTTEQCWVVDISDPGAEGTHRRKEVYLSTNTWTDPDTQTVYNQSPNRVRIVKTPDGEQLYRNWTGTVGGQNVHFIYQGGGRLFAFAVDGRGVGKAGYYKSNLAAGDLDVVPADWSAWKAGYTDAVANSQFYMTKKTDPLGRNLVFTVDVAHGDPTQTTYYDNTTSHKTYDPNGHDWVTSETDRLGRRTDYDLDAHGNMLTRTRAAQAPVAEQSVERWTYNGRGQTLTYTDADGNETDYEYFENAADPGYKQLKKVTEPADETGGTRAQTSYTYDARGLLTSVTDPTGRVTSYSYDDRARLTRTTYADDSYEELTYGTGNDANLVVQKRDRSGDLTTYAYDSYGRKITEIIGAGSSQPSVSSYTYLDGTTLVETQTVNGEQTTFGYDLENRLVSRTVQPRSGVSLTSTSTYDDARQLANETDPYGRKTYYAYDVNYRVTRTVREMVPGALASVPATHVDRNTYLNNLSRDNSANAAYLIEDTTYDAEGEVLTRTDGRGIVSKSTYDSQGRLIEQTEAFGTAVAAKTKRIYDAQGNVTEIQSPRYFDSNDTNGNGKAHVTLAYTHRNLLKSRTEAAGVSGVEATESFTYYLDKRAKDHTDFRGNVWTTTWGACCGRVQAQIEPAAKVDGSGTDKRSAHVTRHDDYGDLTHEGIIVNIDDATFPALPTPTNVTDLPDAGTLREITYRYDARHRKIARRSGWWPGEQWTGTTRRSPGEERRGTRP